MPSRAGGARQRTGAVALNALASAMTVRPTTRIVAILLALAASACWGLAVVVAKAELDSGITPVRLSGSQLCKFLGCSRRNSHERLEIVLRDDGKRLSARSAISRSRRILAASPVGDNETRMARRSVGWAERWTKPVLQGRRAGSSHCGGHGEYLGKLALGHRLSLSEFPDQMGPHLGQPTLLQSLLHVGAHELRNEKELRQCILA